jgi:hypothetical protein
MTTTREITALEDASRTATAYLPEAYDDDDAPYGLLLTATLPALFILGIAAAMLFTLV